MTKEELDPLNIHSKGVHAHNSGSVVALGVSVVYAYGTAIVKAYDDARIIAADSVNVRLWNRAVLARSMPIRSKMSGGTYNRLLGLR